MKHFIITILIAHFFLNAFSQNNVIIQAFDAQVNVGSEITYPIIINPNGNSVGAFSLEIEYDHNLFQILNLEGTNDWTVVSNPYTPGIIKVGGYKVGGQNSTFKAFNLTFNAIGQTGQTSQIKLNVEIVSDNNSQTLNHQYSNGSILINGCNPINSNDVCKADLVVNCGNTIFSSNTVSVNNVVVTNNGNAEAPYSFIAYYLSSDAGTISSDLYLGYDYIPTLAEGLTSAKNRTIDLSNFNISDGTYYLKILADFTGLVAESNENNNSCYISLEPYLTEADLCRSDANTLLLLPFNNTLNGVNGETPFNSSAPSFTTGKYKNALNIPSNGNESILSYTSESNFDQQQGTIEAWVKPNWSGDDGKSHVLFQYGNTGGVLVIKDGANNIRLIFNLLSPLGFPEINVGYNTHLWEPNVWRHLAFTWGNGLISIYANGELLSSNTYSNSIGNIDAPYFNIGNYNGTHHWDGLIDQFRISNKALSAEEIKTHMLACSESGSRIQNIQNTQSIENHNYPNPFKANTTIEFDLPLAAKVNIKVYNAIGKQVAVLLNKANLSEGKNFINFNGSNYPSGVYYYSIENNNQISLHKMILMK